MPLLARLDSTTGLPVRRSPARRDEHPSPEELVHVDIEELGRTPDGGGYRILGRQADRRDDARSGRGNPILHHAVEDHSRLAARGSRLAYSEILTDARKETAAASWTRANAFPTTAGITVTRAWTGNGAS